MSLIHNEQTKLTATALNKIGVALVITGFVAPAVAPRAGPTDEIALLAGLIWLFVGFILHSIAKLILSGPRP